MRRRVGADVVADGRARDAAAQAAIARPCRCISGIWGCPTVVNNVETIATVVPIINVGGAEYSKYGTGTPGQGPASRGTKLITISGHVKKPGNYEIVLGTTLTRLIYSDEFGGGIKDDKQLKFVIPGGSSVPLITARLD